MEQKFVVFKLFLIDISVILANIQIPLQNQINSFFLCMIVNLLIEFIQDNHMILNANCWVDRLLVGLTLMFI